MTHVLEAKGEGDRVAFEPDEQFPHVCENCGWHREDHREPALRCPSTCLLCGERETHCLCEDA
jgi:hypothetical protein